MKKPKEMGLKKIGKEDVSAKKQMRKIAKEKMEREVKAKKKGKRK